MSHWCGDIDTVTQTIAREGTFYPHISQKLFCRPVVAQLRLLVNAHDDIHSNKCSHFFSSGGIRADRVKVVWPLHPPFKTGRRRLSSWSVGKLANYRRGTSWWLFGLTNPKLLYCHQTLDQSRQSQYSDGWKKPLTSRTLTCQHPSSHTINTWEVSTWTTSWGLTIPLVDQELSGGDTFFGSSLMLQSSMQWFWNTFLLSNYHQDVTPSNLILPSSSLVGSVGGRGILIRKERAPPWLWLYLIFQDIGKWNFLGGRERASTALTMDTKPPLVALPKQHSDVVAVK